MSILSNAWNTVKTKAGNLLSGALKSNPVTAPIANTVSLAKSLTPKAGNLLSGALKSNPVTAPIANTVSLAKSVVNAVSPTKISTPKTVTPPTTISSKPKTTTKISTPTTSSALPSYTGTSSPSTFSLNVDTKNGIDSSYLGTTNTVNNVLNTNAKNNPYAEITSNYLEQVSPYQKQLVEATQYSPEYIQARKEQLATNQGYRKGLENIRQRPEALDFQQGQQSALTRDTALVQQAQAENLALEEAIRTNKIETAQAGIGLANQSYQNVLSGIQAMGGRYEYQQITDPNTGFPTIAQIDKLTGQTVGYQSPGTSVTTPQTNTNVGVQTNDYGSQVISSTMQMIGATGNMPLSDAINTLGMDKIIQGIIGQEGGSPQGVINNPGNIKFGTFAQKNGGVDSGVQATDGGTFASFPNIQSGVNAVGNLIKGYAGQGYDLASFIAKYKGVEQTGTQNGQNLPSILSQYVQNTIEGTPYINADYVAPAQQNAVKILASQYNIPFLTSEEVAKVRSIDVTQENLSKLSEATKKVLSGGIGGRIKGIVGNTIKQILQTDQDISSFNTFRDTAINTIQALAGGSGSGFRLNQAEIDTATSNLPTIHDNLETAQRKLVLLNSFLNEWKNQLLPNQQSNTNVNNEIKEYNGHTYIKVNGGWQLQK